MDRRIPLTDPSTEAVAGEAADFRHTPRTAAKWSGADFAYAHANDAATDPSTYYWTAINEVATASGRTLQTSNFSGTQNWTDTYKNCD